MVFVILPCCLFTGTRGPRSNMKRQDPFTAIEWWKTLIGTWMSLHSCAAAWREPQSLLHHVENKNEGDVFLKRGIPNCLATRDHEDMYTTR